MGTFNKMRLMVFFLMTLTSGTLPVFVSSQSLSGDSLVRVPVKLNDTIRRDSLYLLVNANGPLVEVKNFMDSIIHGSFHPFSSTFHQYGFMVQYGKSISFTRLGYARGMYNCKLISMVPPATSRFIGNDSVYFAPLSFLASTIAGTVSYDAIAGRLDITVSPAQGFGSVFPPARDVAGALKDSGYVVQQAGIYKSNPIDFCLGGYTPNANGNNASFPYFCNLTPPSPYLDSLYDAPLTYNFGRDEALVVIGKTPPECIYYSYRSYLYSRLYDFPLPGTRLKVNASLGDTKSLYTMREDLPPDSMFQRKFAIIMAGDSLMAMQVKRIILKATPEIPAADIFFDIIPKEMYRFGNDPQGDWGNFLHRVSLFSDTAAQNSYMNNPTLEIMRLTPVKPRSPVFFKLPAFRARTCGTTEFSLVPDLESLEENIYGMYNKEYQIIWLQPSVSVPEGFIAIQQGWDALGEVRDALYNQTADFQFRENDIALAYGVNHAMTGKSVYSNVSCYGKKYQDGFGGITNFMMEKSARRFISDTATADRLFAYSFSRHPIPGDPYVFIVPSDTNGTLEGINVNDTAYLGFRSYINTLTKIGPDPMEVILDRTVLLRPGGSGVGENGDSRQTPTMKVFPNPSKDKVTLEFSLPDWSDVTLTLYNSTGQQLGQPVRIDHVRSKVLQEMKLSGNMPSGIYYIHGTVSENYGTKKHTLISKLVFLGRTGQ